MVYIYLLVNLVQAIISVFSLPKLPVGWLARPPNFLKAILMLWLQLIGPTAVRGVFYSIAAAIGKIFAFIASYVYERGLTF